MFRIKYRYPVILILAVYSYFNTVFSEVYSYYNIKAPVYLILSVFILITLLVWESNRLIQKKLQSLFSSNDSINFLLLFFFTGLIISGIISVSIVLAANKLFLHFSTASLKMSLKLTFTYA